MAMDFFKNCTTNVHVVENIFQTQYSVYDFTEQDEQVAWTRIHETLVRLRERNVLCSLVENAIWIFGEVDNDIIQAEASGLQHATDSGLIGPDADKTSAGRKAISDIFLDAIEGAVAFNLAKESSIVHAGPWKWIYSHMDEYGEQSAASSVIRLHPKLVRTGALYLISDIKAMPYSLVKEPSHGEDVFLAPCGTAARISGMKQSTVASADQWKSSVSLALRVQGIVLETDTDWILVQPVAANGEIEFPWPSELCFAQSPLEKSSVDTRIDGSSWRPWFATTDDHDAFRNPLVMAEEWIHDVTERSSTGQASKDAEDFAAADLTSALPGSANGPVNDNSTISPPLNQRLLDQQAAMAGIYPTPPDGLAQPPQMSQNNPANTPSVTQGEMMPTNDLLPTSDESQLGPNDLNALPTAEGFSMEQEDLFGDVPGMEFEENDIGDADFNFFDDQPADLSGLEMDADMLDVIGGQQSMENTAVEEMHDDSKDEMPVAVETMTEPDSQVKGLEAEHVPTPNAAPAMETENDVKEEPPGVCLDNSKAEPEKPLSPFGIRERLLPPPVPASIAQHETRDTESRRNSAFSPITFRNTANWKEKYAFDVGRINSTKPSSTPSVPDISLPKTRKKSRTLERELAPKQDAVEESESEEDSFESSSSESEPDLPPKMPWDTRKRKRHSEHDPLHPLAGSLAQMRSDDTMDEDPTCSYSSAEALTIIRKYLISPDATYLSSTAKLHDDGDIHSDLAVESAMAESLVALEDDLPAEDLIYIAQIVAEQAVTTLTAARLSREMLIDGTSRHTIATTGISGSLKALRQALEATFREIQNCDLAKMAASREPVLPPRTIANGKAPQAPPPRPPQRADSTMPGQDYFPLQAPYVRIQRGNDGWELLSSCLSFWETLGLGPTAGPKDVRAFCVFPDNDDLQNLVEHFLADIGTSYESCKLGSHLHLRNVTEEDDCFEDGMAPVELEESSLQGALKAYANTCVELGRALASHSQKEVDRTIVVYMINPFPGLRAIQHLCACFWQLFKAYKDNLSKAIRAQSSNDIVLQLIPIDLIAAPDMLVVPDSRQMATLAREVYDRCPPTSAAQNRENTSELPILAAPALELAGAAPRKIGFQLASEPPSDLLHEGSILHVAYAVSNDRQWMTVVWIDTTGQHQASTSFCLRGKSLAEVAEEVWERTREILDARQVTWRVFIVTHHVMDKSISQCWRVLSSKVRAQSLCVTLLTVDLDPVLQLSSPALENAGFSDGGFLTPASTPQAMNMTSSPDVTGHGTVSNAPPTPAPSETAASIAENDPDAHLIDTTDETWGALISPKLANINENALPGLATGALFRRGDENNETLGSTGVTVHWTIQMKPNGVVDEGSPKQGELTLREVLKMYRNLGLLTSARGLELESVGKGPVPVHVAGAVRGVRGLEGMLRRGE